MKTLTLAAAALALAAGLSSAPRPAAATEPCAKLHSQLRFCAGIDGWRRLKRAVPEALGVFLSPDKAVGKVIVETAPHGTHLDATEVEAAILGKVGGQVAAGGGEVEVLASAGGATRGNPMGTILYAFDFEGRRVLTLHSYMVRDDLVVQFITAAPDPEDRDRARATHRDFVTRFRLSGPETLL